MDTGRPKHEKYTTGRNDSVMPHLDIHNAHERNTEIPEKASADITA
jgi:hypothetical protein